MGKLEKYSSYKDSAIEWLGEIPEHWKLIKLKFLLKEKVSDGPHETPTFIDEGVPFLSVDGIQDGELTFEKCRYVSKKDHNLYSKKANVTKGSILMGKAASTGKIAQVKVNFPFSIWSPLALIKSNEQISSSILEYYLKSHYSQIQIDWFCNINTQKNIGMGDIPKILVVLPPQEEQTKIASFLDNKTAQIDEFISQKQKLIELLKERKQIVINDAVTKGLDKDVEFVYSGVEWIGNIPKHWEIKKLKYVFKEINERSETGEEELLSLSKYQGVIPKSSLEERAGMAKTLVGYKKVYKNDLVINKMQAVNGLLAVSKIEGITSPDYAVYRTISNKYNIDYYGNLLSQSVYLSEFKKVVTGVMEGFIRLYTDDLYNIIVQVPPKDEQFQIIEYIENQITKIDKAIELQQNYISKLKEYKASLIDSVVTGKVKVYCD